MNWYMLAKSLDDQTLAIFMDMVIMIDILIKLITPWFWDFLVTIQEGIGSATKNKWINK